MKRSIATICLIVHITSFPAVPLAASRCLIGNFIQIWTWNKSKDDSDPKSGVTRESERYSSKITAEAAFELEQPDTISADYLTKSWKVTAFEGSLDGDSYHKSTSCRDDVTTKTSRSRLVKVEVQDSGYGEAGYLQIELESGKPTRVSLPSLYLRNTWDFNSREERTICGGSTFVDEDSTSYLEILPIGASTTPGDADPLSQNRVQIADGSRLQGGGTKTWTDDLGVAIQHTLKWTLDKPGSDCSYKTVWDTLLDRMAWLRAYADPKIANWSATKGEYEKLVGARAEKIYRKSAHPKPGRPVRDRVITDVDMGSCEITPPEGDICRVEFESAIVHENVHQERCLALNDCQVDHTNPLKPSSCRNPGGYTAWENQDPVKMGQLDEIEAYCKSVEPLVQWLENYQQCDNPRSAKNKERRRQLKQQNKLIHKICG